MCLAVPGLILSINGLIAEIEVMGVETYANIQLIDNPIAGDYVLIHAGFAIQRINTEYFNFLHETIEELISEEYYNE